MPTSKPSPEVPVAQEPVASPPVATMTPLPAQGITTATVGVDAAVSQVKALVPGGADVSPSVMIAGAATLAVIGGAIKFGPQMLKARAEKQSQEHELRMRELDLKQDQQQKSEDQHKACAVERATLEAKVMALESKIAGLEAKKSEAIELGGVDLGDLQERLEKIEGFVKPPAARRGRPRQGKS